jgi:hypothetical protein
MRKKGTLWQPNALLIHKEQMKKKLIMREKTHGGRQIPFS